MSTPPTRVLPEFGTAASDPALDLSGDPAVDRAGDPALDPAVDPAIHRRRWAILAVLCLSVLLIVVDNTIVNVALPTLNLELGATTSQLQWIVDAYTLVFAGLLLAAGSLGDRFGRKGTLQVGMVLFGLFSVMGALAGSPEELIAARAAMGIGAALIFPATLALLVNVFTRPKERAAAIGIWAATSGLAVAIGPVTGGWLLEHYYWGSIFLVNVPIVVVAVIAIGLLVPRSKDPDAARFDVPGVVLSIAGITSVVWAIIEAPHKGWTSVPVVAAFTLGAALLAAFIAVEQRSSHPMLDVRVFSNMRFTAGSLAVTFAFFALFGFIFLVTQYFQFVRGYDAFSAGLHTLPFAVFVGMASPLSPRLVERAGTKLVVTAGLASMAVGFSIAAVLSATAPYWVIVVSMFFMGGGLGLVNAPATEAILGSLPPEKAGVGSAVNDTTRELGGTLGVAIVGSLFSSLYAARLSDSLAGLPIPADARDAATESVGAAMVVAQQAGEQAGPAARETVRNAVADAFMSGFHLGTAAAAVVVAIGAVIAWRYLPARAGREAVAAHAAADADGRAPAAAPALAGLAVATAGSDGGGAR